MALMENTRAMFSTAMDAVSILGNDFFMVAVAAAFYTVLIRGHRRARFSGNKVLDAKQNPEAVAQVKYKARETRSGGEHRVRPSSLCGGNTIELQLSVDLIKAHASKRDLSSAAAVFSASVNSGAKPNPIILNCFLDACIQCGDLTRAAAHFVEMKRLNCVDVCGYNTILKAYLSRGQSKEASTLVREMTAQGIHANIVTYNEMLNAKVVAKDRRGMWNIVDRIVEAGMVVNAVGCSILLKSLTPHSSRGDVDRVMSFVEQVDVTKDEVLLASLIDACICAKRLDLLLNVRRRIQKMDSSANLRVSSYGTMIKAYGQVRNVACVREVWNEMETLDMQRTSVTIGCMVEALVVNGHVDEAWDLVHKELDSGRNCVNTVIYSTILKGYSAACRMDKVYLVYQDMRNNNISCNTITYNTMLNACAKCSAMCQASSLLEDMKAAGVAPDIVTYSTIMKGYCLHGDVDRAFDVLQVMRDEAKLIPDEIMYNSVLDGCAKQRRVEEAMRILDEMKVAGIAPSNYTLNIIVKMLSRSRRLNEAFRMVEDLCSQNGFRPNIQVYTCLMQACIVNRRLDRGLALHDDMASDGGCAADKKFYAALVLGCLKLHQPLKAAEVVRAAYMLPGHTLKVGWKRPPVGVDSDALDEIVVALKAGTAEERRALATLNADLWEQRGVNLDHKTATIGGPGHDLQRRSRPGGAGRVGGRSRR